MCSLGCGYVDQVWRAVAVELVATAGFTFLSVVVTCYEKSIAEHAFLLAAIYSLVILAATPTSVRRYRIASLAGIDSEDVAAMPWLGPSCLVEGGDGASLSNQRQIVFFGVMFVCSDQGVGVEVTLDEPCGRAGRAYAVARRSGVLQLRPRSLECAGKLSQFSTDRSEV